ncbi:MAG: hypothetical protein QOF58_8278 [Pseudonocardiales bacterium]|jgi:hypothetical protein|nr:hypothetical protein [Pseudonocardiales bacterium]
MLGHGQQDLTDRIDSLTNDAATWSTGGDHTSPRWATASPGSMAAIALDMISARPAEISETNPARDIARHVGDPFCPLFTALRKVQFHVGVRSSVRQPLNTLATKLLYLLLLDIRDGRYIASDAERDYARSVLELDAAPVIHGPCLITGATEDSAPAPLDDNFQSWLSALLEEIAQHRAKRVAALAAAIGIALEGIGDTVVLVQLG